MIKIIVLLLICVALAWVSEVQTRYNMHNKILYQKRKDLAFFLLCLVLSLFAGLRTDYNDTWNYIKGFRTATGLVEFLQNPENLGIFQNPLFYLFQSLLKEITNEEQILILLSSAFVQCSFMVYLKRYSERFTFSVFLYIALGTFQVYLGAIKQTMAMAILTWSIPYLEQKKWIRFYLVVFMAMLMHTYAVMYVVLPFFMGKPWKSRTFLLVGAILFVLNNFQEIAQVVMEQANLLGKKLEAYEVLDAYTVNLFRVAVYVVPPLFSFVFARWINYRSSARDYILIHMSIISMAFMLIATQAGANMFARMAHYFELGTLCALPNMIDKPFSLESRRLIFCLAILGFAGFFAVQYGGFDDAYKGLGILGMF